MRWASGMVNNVIDAPARLSAVPNLAVPTIEYWRAGFVVRIVTRSPTWRLPSSAVCRSMTISSPVRGARPVTRWNWFSVGLVIHPSPKVGGPLPPIALPFLPTTCAYGPVTWPSAASTVGARFTVSTSDAGMLGRWPVPKSLSSTWGARTTASVVR